MKIDKIIYQSRRDFKADFKCEFCGHTENKWGYDDSNYHDNVIPNMVCPQCNKHSGVVTSKATNPDYMQY